MSSSYHHVSARCSPLHPAPSAIIANLMYSLNPPCPAQPPFILNQPLTFLFPSFLLGRQQNRGPPDHCYQPSFLATRPSSRAILLVGRSSLLLPHDGGLSFLGAGKFGAGLIVLLFLYERRSQNAPRLNKKGKQGRRRRGRGGVRGYLT